MKNNEYWNNFYSDAKLRGRLHDCPSQFAAFVVNEFADTKPIIFDLACGNGRDSNFFSTYGFYTTGIDSSESAVKFCQEKYKIENLNFFCSDLVHKSTYDRLKQIIMNINISVLFYSRFFIHSITEDQQIKFFHQTYECLPKNSYLALEFRIEEDENNDKIFLKNHFRRYCNEKKIIQDLISVGYNIDYSVKGVGYAKYNAEDAIVCRIIAKK